MPVKASSEMVNVDGDDPDSIFFSSLESSTLDPSPILQYLSRDSLPPGPTPTKECGRRRGMKGLATIQYRKRMLHPNDATGSDLEIP